MPALAELEAAWVEARDDAGFRAELDRAAARLRRPADAAVPGASGCPRRAGRPVWLKREDLDPHRRAQDQQRARPGAAGRAHGQAAHHRRDRRGPARRRDAPPRARCSASSASSTWAPRTCAASSPTSQRMGLLGATRRAGRGRRAHAQGGGHRGDPRLGRRTSATPTTSSARRRPGAVPGDGARPPARDRRRGARADARSARARCPSAWSPASAAARTRSACSSPFVDDAEVELIGVEAAGEGIETGRHGAPLTAAGRGGVLHGAYSASCRTRTARSSRRTRSRPASTTPASGPSTRTCATPAARATWRSPTTRRWPPSASSPRLEGIIPALESAHAIAWVLADAPRGRELDLVCLSGRGDKDLAEVARAQLATRA